MGNDGTVTIMGPNDVSVQEAAKVIRLMIQEVEVGEIYRCSPPPFSLSFHTISLNRRKYSAEPKNCQIEQQRYCLFPPSVITGPE